MPRGSDNVLSAVPPLIARCPTFEAATSTVEYLCSRGVPRQALSVVVDEVQPAAGARDGGRWLRWRRWRAARTRAQRRMHPEPEKSRQYYIISDESSARRARLLLHTGANALEETFGVRAVPCVGQLHPSCSIRVTGS
jgi:hypothetical protein